MTYTMILRDDRCEIIITLESNSLNKLFSRARAALARGGSVHIDKNAVTSYLLKD